MLIPLVLKQLFVLLGEGLSEYLFLKILRLSKFQIDLSRGFHSIIAEREKEFFNKLCLK